jgi:hypothetical protein
MSQVRARMFQFDPPHTLTRDGILNVRVHAPDVHHAQNVMRLWGLPVGERDGWRLSASWDDAHGHPQISSEVADLRAPIDWQSGA